MESNSGRRKSTGQGILKQPSGMNVNPNQHTHNNDTCDNHIKFDEEEIAEHDKSRGTRQKIDEPKTPYANDDEMIDTDDQMNTNANVQVNYTGDDVQMHDQSHSQQQHDPHQHKVEEEVKKHLEEAERNKLLNAQLQKEQAQQYGSGGVNPNFNDQLMQKLDTTQQELDEEERKHREFLKKRKEHYKNEMKAAQLLKQQSQDDDDEEDQ